MNPYTLTIGMDSAIRIKTLTYLYLSLCSISFQTAYRNKAEEMAENSRNPNTLPNICIPAQANMPTIGGWSKYPQAGNMAYM